jgi:hypothetical protein
MAWCLVKHRNNFYYYAISLLFQRTSRLALLLHIQEVSGSNLCSETKYYDWFHGYPQSLQTSAG